MRRFVSLVAFNDAGIVVEFSEIYGNDVVRQQTVTVPLGPDSEYLDEAEAVQNAIVALIDDVLEDVEQMTPLSDEDLITQLGKENDDDRDDD